MTTLWNECQKTAKKLDSVYPGWADKVDIDTLNMRKCRTCILGQILNREYDLLLGHLILGIGRVNMTTLGYANDTETSKLNKYWKTLIKQRR